MKLFIVAACVAIGAYIGGSLGALIAAGLSGGTIGWLSSRNTPDKKIKEMRKSLDYDADEQEYENKSSDLIALDQLAAALEAPSEIFSLNTPLENTLNSWSPEEISVLKFRVSNFIRNEKLSEHQTALKHLLNRLEPLSPKSIDEIDSEAFKEAILKMYDKK